MSQASRSRRPEKGQRREGNEPHAVLSDKGQRIPYGSFGICTRASGQHPGRRQFVHGDPKRKRDAYATLNFRGAESDEAKSGASLC
jgi:hypothetical protein